MENPAQGGGYLVIRNLYKAFGDFYALKDISLDINQGEFGDLEEKATPAPLVEPIVLFSKPVYSLK